MIDTCVYETINSGKTTKTRSCAVVLQPLRHFKISIVPFDSLVIAAPIRWLVDQ